VWYKMRYKRRGFAVDISLRASYTSGFCKKNGGEGGIRYAKTAEMPIYKGL